MTFEPPARFFGPETFGLFLAYVVQARKKRLRESSPILNVKAEGLFEDLCSVRHSYL